MQVTYSPRFRRSFRAAPLTIQRTFERKLAALFMLPVSDLLRHPGLRAKKFPERGPQIWQGRVTRDWRFYFTIEGDTVVLHDISSHPK